MMRRGLAILLWVTACSSLAGCGSESERTADDPLKAHEGAAVEVHVLWNNDRDGSGQIASRGKRSWTDGVVNVNGKLDSVTPKWVVVAPTTDGPKTFIPRDRIVLVDVR
jgi:hypothetical protein